MSLHEKISCSVRVPAIIKVTEVILQAEIRKSWLCYSKRFVYPIVKIHLDPSRREKLPGKFYAYPVCCIHINLNLIEELEEPCFVKMKVKKGQKTVRKKGVDARHLIRCLKEHQNFGKIHFNVDISSFHPLTSKLQLMTKGVQEAKEELPLVVKEKFSCSVRVPETTIRVNEIILQAEVKKSVLCCPQKYVYPIIRICLDPARREKLPNGAYGYAACCMYIDLKRIQNLEPDCFVKMKIKRGMRTVGKEAVDAQHLIQSLKEQHKFDQIHINLDVSSFHPLNFELRLKTKTIQEAYMEFIRAQVPENKISCSVVVPTITSIRDTEIIMQAEIIKSCLCYAKKSIYPIMEVYLDPSRRRKLPGGSYGYPLSCIHVDLSKIQEVRDDCFVEIKVNTGMATMKKGIEARHLIHCLKEHDKFSKIHIKLDVSSFHPLNFQLNTEVMELQPGKLLTPQREEELTRESVLPPASLTSSPRAVEDTAVCNESNEPAKVNVIQDDMTKVQQRNEKNVETKIDKSQCRDEIENLKGGMAMKGDEREDESETLKESDEWEDMSDECDVESSEWEDMSDEWEDMSDEMEIQPGEFLSPGREEELTRESVLPPDYPDSISSFLRVAQDTAVYNKNMEVPTVNVIKTDTIEGKQKNEENIETKADKSESKDEIKHSEERIVMKGDNKRKDRSEKLKESDERENRSDECEVESGEWMDMSDEWEDMSDELEDESKNVASFTSPLSDRKPPDTEEGQSARPSRWHDLYHTVKKYAWRAMVVQGVLCTIGAILEPYIPEVELGGGY